ncbi:MAG TPA: hypothetical protein VGU67_02840 [Edaphobacter sp.]|nr:hypothetical protein [Edaphobacter sp.]
MKRPEITCPNCTGPMHPRADKACRQCYHGGRPRSSDHEYAKELGISVRRLRRLGGEAAVRAMPDEARAIFLQPFHSVDSRTVANGGLRARGMKTRTPGRLTQPKTL